MSPECVKSSLFNAQRNNGLCDYIRLTYVPVLLKKSKTDI